LDKLGSEVNPLDADLSTPTSVCPKGNTCGVHLHAVGDGGAVYRGAEGALRLQSRDSMLLSVGEPLPAPTPLTAPDPLGGVHFSMVNNLWNTNYPEFYPFHQGDENSRFRFVLTVTGGNHTSHESQGTGIESDEDALLSHEKLLTPAASTDLKTDDNDLRRSHCTG
jgi:hypothetical protein